MTIAFVTGATGFLGLQLTKRLIENGVAVRCLVRAGSKRSSLEKLGVEFIEGDIHNLDSLRRGAEGADAVFHLAGLTRAENLKKFMAVNRDGCRNTAQAVSELNKTNLPVLVSVSSLAAAGPGFKNSTSERKSTGNKFRRITESDPPNPYSPYGKSKLAGEKELLSFADQIPITIVRPAYVFGEGDLLSLPLFRIAGRSPFFWHPGYRIFPYSFVYVQDLISLLIAAAENGERLTPSSHANGGKGIYFASGPEDYSLLTFGKMISRAVGRKNPPRSFCCPPVGLLGYAAIAGILGRICRFQPSLDWNKAIEALGGPWICSAEKAASHFGISATPLQEGLNRTAKWYQDEKKL